MTDTIRTLLLVTSSVLIICSSIPYMVDIVKRKTKPRVVSWFNWAILGVIAGAAALSAGQIPAAVLSFASAAEVMLIVILGLYYGDRHFEKIDLYCQIGAGIGLLLWYFSDNPLLAIVVTTVIDLIVALPTYKHIWQKPYEETLSVFVLCAIASALTLATITTWDMTGLLYPVYILLANAVMAGMIMYRRQKYVH